MIDINKVSEGVDYELIPAEIANEQAWHIRILSGDFVETVIVYGNLEIDGKSGHISFSFKVVESPDNELTPENEALQQFCGSILHELIEAAIAKDELVMTDKI